MAIVTIQSLKDKWITGYKPTQADYVDLFDTMTNLETIVGASGVVPDGSSIGNAAGTSNINFNGVYLELTGALKLLNLAGGGNQNIYVDNNGAIIAEPKPVVPFGYKILASQIGVSNPTIDSNGSGANTPFLATIPDLTLGRVSTGNYIILWGGGISGGPFILDKTFIHEPQQRTPATGTIRMTWVDDTQILIETFDSSNNPSDNILNSTAIFVEVYP